MIVTVTMNPAIDKTAEVDELVLGGVNKLRVTQVDAGGKGINVSKVLRVLNKPNMAIGFIGGNMGSSIRAKLQKQMIMADFIPVEGETRCNLKVRSAFGMTEFDEPGPNIKPAIKKTNSGDNWAPLFITKLFVYFKGTYSLFHSSCQHYKKPHERPNEIITTPITANPPNTPASAVSFES